MKKKISALFGILFLLASIFSVNLESAAQSSAFDTVLVIDVSGSIYGSMEDIKLSAKNFCDEIIAMNPENKIAIVSFSTYSEIDCDLTNDINTLYTAIDGLYSDGLTNISDACMTAEAVITSSASQNSAKNVIIMTDGFPEGSSNFSDGYFSSNFPEMEDIANQADYAIEYVEEHFHNKNVNVYSVGFFYFDAQNESALTYDEKFMVEFVRALSNSGSFFPDSAENVFDDVIIVVESTTENTTVTTTESTTVTTTESTTVTTTAPTTQETTSLIVSTSQQTTVYTAQPQTETTTEVIYSSIDINSDVHTVVKSDATVTTIAIGTAATIGTGGLIALVIYLLTRKPKVPVVPVIPPVIFPVSDKDDDGTRINQNIINSVPKGIESFAADNNIVSASEYINIPTPAAACISVTEGMYSGARIEISDGDVIKIGRDASVCNLVMSNESMKVSRVHCSIEYNAAQQCFVVTDLSSNGTFADGERISSGVPVYLPFGTRIRIADSKDEFILGSV